MNLIELASDYNIVINPILYSIKAFKDLIDRDKKKDKSRAIAEISFIYFYCDIRSDYMYITDLDKRVSEIKNDLADLPKDWSPDDKVLNAVEVYKKRSTTILSALYESSCRAASDVSRYLDKTEELLEERDNNGKPIHDISKITTSLQRIPIIMKNLKLAHQELVKEQKEMEGRKTGERDFNLFEDGLEI